jgi:glutamate-5-semialdehyde dehydrogenase
LVIHDEDDFLGLEWEWDDRPELSVVSAADLDEAVGLFNRWAPRFIVSVLSADEHHLEHVYRSTEAPFVGDGFTRWVDGQYALARPELGLSNWQHGRLFGRGGILSGDGVYAVRHVAFHEDPSQRR